MPAATFASLAATPSRLFVLFEAPGVVLEPVQGVVFEVGGGLGERAPRVWRARVAVVVLRVPPSPRAVGWGEASVARRGGGGVRWELREPVAPTERSLDHVHVLKSLFALS